VIVDLLNNYWLLIRPSSTIHFPLHLFKIFVYISSEWAINSTEAIPGFRVQRT